MPFAAMMIPALCSFLANSTHETFSNSTVFKENYGLRPSLQVSDTVVRSMFVFGDSASVDPVPGFGIFSSLPYGDHITFTSLWLRAPSIEVLKNSGPPRERLMFESPLEIARTEKVAVVRLPMSDGLSFEVFATGDVDCNTIVTLNDDLRAHPPRFERAIAIVELPRFRFSEKISVRLGQAFSFGKDAASVTFDFTLPDVGQLPQGAIPLKGRIPNTFLFRKSFAFLILDKNREPVIAGVVR